MVRNSIDSITKRLTVSKWIFVKIYIFSCSNTSWSKNSVGSIILKFELLWCHVKSRMFCYFFFQSEDMHDTMPISSFLQKERPRTAAFSPAYTPPRYSKRGKLSNHPSPKSTLTLSCHLRQNVWLGRGPKHFPPKGTASRNLPKFRHWELAPNWVKHKSKHSKHEKKEKKV